MDEAEVIADLAAEEMKAEPNRAAKAALAELARLHRSYSLLEEMSPPDVPRSKFVRWCVEAWERQCEADQAIEHLINEKWMLRLFRDSLGEVRVIAIHPDRGLVHAVDVAGETFAEAVVALAAKVEEA